MRIHCSYLEMVRRLLSILVASSLLNTFQLQPNVQVSWRRNLSGDFQAAVRISSESCTQDLWVDAVNGNNENDGLSSATAFQTIQRAAGLAGPGTTIHIQPGNYRESIIPAQSGTDSGTILYKAESGPGTVKIRGSEPSSAFTWVQLTSNSIGLPTGVDPTKIYYADLSAWGFISPPRFVVELDNLGEVIARLPLAREPDWVVVNEWKYHEYWWAADGGSDVASCYPPDDENPLDCDMASRSLTQLTDRHNDVEPNGIEPGNLTSLGNLAMGKLVVMDTNIGTYVFRRTIISHDVAAGRITVDQKCEIGSGSNEPALGWGSKYYIEGLPRLLDAPGEWWYDQASGRLYLWPRISGNPANLNIEISHREDGFKLQNRSYITLDGLSIEFFNRNAVYASNMNFGDKSHNDTILNSNLRYDDNGIWLNQYLNPLSPVDNSIDSFKIENSEIAYMDNQAIRIYYSWGESSSADSFMHPGVTNTVIRHNELHHLGFRADSEGIGMLISFPDHVRFEENYVHHVSHVGVLFKRSVIQSSKEYNFTPQEIKTGNILIRGNIFEIACQNHSDCSALKITGTPPDMQVFRDLLVTQNIFWNTFGWTFILEKRGVIGGPSSAVDGMMGMGLYIDNASGISAYRNIAYNNAFAGFKFSGSWRDGDILYYNNLIANSLNGFHFGGKEYDTHDGSVNTQLVNNIILNHESFGILLSDADGFFENTTINHNLYYNNGWRSYIEGGEWNAGDIRLDVPVMDLYYQTLTDIQAGTAWEDDGQEGNPNLWNYAIDDHDLYDGSWPTLHLTSSSSYAIDKGSVVIPDSITELLRKFGVLDPHWGTAFDIGRYESGFAILPNPSAMAVEPGGVAQYLLSLYPSDLPYPVSLSTSPPPPGLMISLEPEVITYGTTAALTITDTHSMMPLMPGLWFSIQINGEGAEFTNSSFVYLLVGGTRLYLPVMLRD